MTLPDDPVYQRYLGLDVHKDFIQVAALDAQGNQLFERRIPNNEELEFFALTLRRTDAVALEATCNAFALHDLFSAHAGEVVVVNAYRTKLIAQSRVKTDKVDALVLAQLLRTRFIATVWVPPREIRELRSLLALRTSLNRQGTCMKNSIHAMLRGHRLRFGGKELFSVKGRQWLDQQTWSNIDRFRLNELLSMLDSNQASQDRLEAFIAQLAVANPIVQRLMQLHGLGFFSALAVYAEIGDINRFATPGKLASYAGLTPSVHQSGNGQAYYGSITKAGRKRLRWILVEAVQAAARHEPRMEEFFNRVRARKGWNVAIVACAHKLLIRIWHVWHDAVNARHLDPALYTRKLQGLAWAAGGKRLRELGDKNSAAFINRTCTELGVMLSTDAPRGRERRRRPAPSAAPQPTGTALNTESVVAAAACAPALATASR
jgi:transposase